MLHRSNKISLRRPWYIIYIYKREGGKNVSGENCE